jgi:hypothetical protein
LAAAMSKRRVCACNCEPKNLVNDVIYGAVPFLLGNDGFVFAKFDTMNTVSDCLSLPALHQRTVAVQLSVQGHSRVLKGYGIYEHDNELGPVLRIKLRGGTAQFLLAEESWNGEIVRDQSAGCDFLVLLN